MADREVELLPTIPSVARALGASMVSMVTRKLAGDRPASLPGREVRVVDVIQDPAKLAAYDRVCGLTVRDAVPPTWIHVLTFPLQMHLLSAGDSPFPLAGLVHVTNSMTQFRPVAVAERLTLTSCYGAPRLHRRGVLVDLIGAAYAGSELVWQGTSSYLARGGSLDGSLPEYQPDGVDLPSSFEDVTPTQVWRLPASLGRSYAGVSGDVNPIHLNPLAAKAFGFPRTIIHGMWTHARVLAALESRLPASYRVDARFTKPVLLPSTVRFGAVTTDTGFDGAVTDKTGGKTNLVVRVTSR